MKAARRKAVEPTEVESPSKSVCVICGRPATQIVDGDPSCDAHVELVYEDQIESYTQSHLKNDEWLEKKA